MSDDNERLSKYGKCAKEICEAIDRLYASTNGKAILHILELEEKRKAREENNVTANIHIRKGPLAANEIICPIGETVMPETCLRCAYHVMGCYYGVEIKV